MLHRDLGGLGFSKTGLVRGEPKHNNLDYVGFAIEIPRKSLDYAGILLKTPKSILIRFLTRLEPPKNVELRSILGES